MSSIMTDCFNYDFSQQCLPQEAGKDRSAVKAGKVVSLSNPEDQIFAKDQRCVKKPNCVDFYTWV